MKKHLSTFKVWGFTLVEMSVVILIVGIILSSYVSWRQVEADDADAKHVANEILDVHTALMGYATTYYDNLTSGTPLPLDLNNYSSRNTSIPGTYSIATVLNLYTPTILELKSFGYLGKYQENTISSWNLSPTQLAPASTQPSKIGNWKFIINKVPAGCVNAGCDLELITYIDQPVTRHNDGVPDELFLAKIAAQGGNKLGYSAINSPAIAKGPNALWQISNPLGQAGILFARTTVNALGLAHFARVMDARPIVVGGNLTVLGSSTFEDISVTGAYNNIASAYTMPGDGGGFVSSTGLVTGKQLIQHNIVAASNTGTTSSGTVFGNTDYAVPQQPCGPIGSTGVGVTGELYTCRYNIAKGGYWILTSEPDCQIPSSVGSNIYVNFGIQSFIVTADQNIQIPNGCYYTKFTFSDALGSFAANDFITFNRSNSLSGQIVQSYLTSMSTTNALIMDRNQQIIAHQTALSNSMGASIKIKVDIAKD